MSYTEVFLLLFGVTSFFLHYVQMKRIEQLDEIVMILEDQLQRPVTVEVIEFAEHDQREMW